MASINILSEDLINKIAAGEVIERPASVVKELIENSLDANATTITIDIKDSGKKLIKITDNGSGMDKDDAKKSIIRHATSKLNTTDDLFAIQTLGFRGEALASIAAVSLLSLTTKQQDTLEGFSLVIEGGNIVNETIAAADPGTTIEVHNLFFNTPARKKFLKTDGVELRHIIDVVTNYALLHPGVSFRLNHEGRELLSSPAVQDQRSNISAIYGTSTAKDLLEVAYKDDLCTLTGFISKPINCRNDKTQQIFFVNNRWVKNSGLSNAVYDGFHSMLFVNKHPIFVLHLTLDPEKVDVNVHPQKSEIKIDQKEQIAAAVTAAVKETLRANNLIPVVDVEFEQQATLAPPTPKPKVEKPGVKYNFEPSEQTILQEPSLVTSHEQLHSIISETVEAEQSAEPELAPLEEDVKAQLSETEKFPPLKLFGQIHKTFFVAETPGGVFFIDQHAAHERVLYERFMKQYADKAVEVQTLLQGEVVEFTAAEVALLNEHHAALEQFGFVIDHFGENSFAIKSVPLIFNRLQPKEQVKEFLHSLSNGKNTLQKLHETIVTRMACRSAYMAGDDLTTQQVQGILKDLSNCEHPYTCPHGRPTMIKTGVFELEKKFKRC